MQVTFTTADGRMESLEVGDELDMAEVRGFVEAMLGVDASGMALTVNGQRLPASGSLAAAGVKTGDVVLVASSGAAAVPAAAAAPPAAAPTPSVAAATAPATAPAPAPAAAAAGTGAGAAAAAAAAGDGGPVFWDGMTVDEVMGSNTNPAHVVDILQAHPRILQELNFHNPELAAHMRKGREEAISELRMFIMMNATTSTLAKITGDQKERDMEARLRANPMDEEANRFFGERIQAQRIEESYRHMMEHYPESLSRVLMLYIEVEINGVSLQAFVDSGAQSSVISGRCAERCNISKDIDKRFAGKVVGVGTGQTLGRVHLANIKIEGNNFPITLTVMDDSQGLGDTNMEFLLGLDMLKRHRCSIELAEGKLYFYGAEGRVSTQFLHEKDLPTSKGGTRDFDPNVVEKQEEEDADEAADKMQQ